MAPIPLYEYLDFREFLSETLKAKKKENRAFSLSLLGRKCGGISKAQLSLVLHGKRSLSRPMAEKLAKALGLSSQEQKYFYYLVSFNQSESATERQLILEDLVRLRPKQAKTDLTKEQLISLRNWHCMLVRELVRIPGFNANPKEISKRFKNRIKPLEAKLALETLVNLNLVTLTSNGTYQVSNEQIHSTSDVSSLLIQNYHSSCLDLGKTVLEHEPIEKREFASVNLVLSEEGFLALKNQMKQFRDRASDQEDVNSTGSSKRKVYQLNMQFFEVAE